MRVEYLTITQVAEQLGISEITVRRRIKKGKIKAELMKGEFGDQYFITLQELDRHKTSSMSVDVVELQKAITPYKLQELLKNTLDLKIDPLNDKIKAMEDSQESLIREIQELKELLQKEELKQEKNWFVKLFSK